MDFQKELQEISTNKEEEKPDRSSFQQFFYEVGAAKLNNNLPSSIIEEGNNWDDIMKPNVEEQNQFNFNAINATIINNEFDKKKAKILSKKT